MPADPDSRFSVSYGQEELFLHLDGDLVGRIRWEAIDLIAIHIEDEFLPCPYWYVGNRETLLRIPNDATGASELFFEGFKGHVAGYDSDAAYMAIIEASGAVEGSFVVWRADKAEA